MTTPDCRKQKFLNSSSAIRNDNTEVIKSESHSVASDSATPWIYSPWNSPGQNTAVGSLSLFQGISTTQGSNPGLPHCITSWVTREIEKIEGTFHSAQLAYQSQVTVRQVIFTQKPIVCYQLVMKIISHLLPKMLFTYFFPYSVFPLLCFLPAFPYLLISLSFLPPSVLLHLNQSPKPA